MDPYTQSRLAMTSISRSNFTQEVTFLLKDFFPTFDDKMLRNEAKKLSKKNMKRKFSSLFGPQFNNLALESDWRSLSQKSAESSVSLALGASPISGEIPELRMWKSAVSNIEILQDLATIEVNSGQKVEILFEIQGISDVLFENPPICTGFSGWTLCLSSGHSIISSNSANTSPILSKGTTNYNCF